MSLADSQKNRITQRLILRQQHGRFPRCCWRLCRCPGTCYERGAKWGAVLARRGDAVPYPRPLRSGEIMRSVRVLFVVLGLSALPLFAVAAQGNGNGNQCKTTPSSPNGRGVGLATAPGQAKKCAVAPAAPPPNQQPAASFTFICSDLSCSFASTSTDPDGTISAYSW